jgi:hypothetical protein
MIFEKMLNPILFFIVVLDETLCCLSERTGNIDEWSGKEKEVKCPAL